MTRSIVCQFAFVIGAALICTAVAMPAVAQECSTPTFCFNGNDDRCDPEGEEPCLAGGSMWCNWSWKYPCDCASACNPAPEAIAELKELAKLVSTYEEVQIVRLAGIRFATAIEVDSSTPSLDQFAAWMNNSLASCGQDTKTAPILGDAPREATGPGVSR